MYIQVARDVSAPPMSLPLDNNNMKLHVNVLRGLYADATGLKYHDPTSNRWIFIPIIDDYMKPEGDWDTSMIYLPVSQTTVPSDVPLPTVDPSTAATSGALRPRSFFVLDRVLSISRWFERLWNGTDINHSKLD